MLSLEERILDHLIDSLECKNGQQYKHYDLMWPLLAKYRSRLDVIERRFKRGSKND